MFFLFFTGTKPPGTTGNSVNQVTKRKLNTGKLKEDFNPFSSFFQIIRTQQLVKITENLSHMHYVLILMISFLIIETLIIPPGTICY